MRKNALLFVVALAIAAALLEGAVRLIFPANLTIGRVETAYFREGIGMLKTPRQTASNIEACLAVPEIRFNSLGFRDNELPKDAAAILGILGDSSMEAMQIPEGEYTAALMETILAKPVLNMSIGGASTVKELQMYLQLMSAYKPKVVLLFFTLGNDILDNGCQTKQTAAAALNEPPYTGTCGTMTNDRAVYRAPWLPRESSSPLTHGSANKSKRFDPIASLRSDCRSCRMINDVLKGTLGLTLSPTTQSEKEAYLAGMNVYRPLDALDASAQAQWREARDVTEHALIDMRDEVAANGGQLLVVEIPDNMRISRDWQKDFKTNYGFTAKPDVDASRPSALLKELTQRNAIPLLQLEPVFLEYRDRHRIDFPYLSYACDGHWNPLGHFLASSWLAQTLVERDYIRVSAPKPFIDARIRERQLSPETILGKEAYRSIYRRGIFRGHSLIASYRPQ